MTAATLENPSRTLRYERVRGRFTRIWPVRWTWLVFNARRDAARGVPRLDEGTVDAPTSPTVRRIDARSVEQARLELLRYRRELADERVRHDNVVGRLRANLAESEALISQGALEPAAQDRLNRLRRARPALESAITRARATLASRLEFAAKQADRYADFGDRQLAVYWTVLRRRHAQKSVLPDLAPSVERGDWRAEVAAEREHLSAPV